MLGEDLLKDGIGLVRMMLVVAIPITLLMQQQMAIMILRIAIQILMIISRFFGQIKAMNGLIMEDLPLLMIHQSLMVKLCQGKP